jgi:hypothetical protein
MGDMLLFFLISLNIVKLIIFTPFSEQLMSFWNSLLNMQHTTGSLCDTIMSDFCNVLKFI